MCEGAMPLLSLFKIVKRTWTGKVETRRNWEIACKYGCECQKSEPGCAFQYYYVLLWSLGGFCVFLYALVCFVFLCVLVNAFAWFCLVLSVSLWFCVGLCEPEVAIPFMVYCWWHCALVALHDIVIQACHCIHSPHSRHQLNRAFVFHPKCLQPKPA